MSPNKIVELKVTRPLVGQFLEEWMGKYDQRRFNLLDSKDQEEFCIALNEMTKHLSHASSSSSISVVLGDQGVKALFLQID